MKILNRLKNKCQRRYHYDYYFYDETGKSSNYIIKDLLDDRKGLKTEEYIYETELESNNTMYEAEMVSNRFDPSYFVNPL